MILWLALLIGLHAAPKPRKHAVEIRGMAFHPADLSVAVGDTVVWINRDLVPHTATGTGQMRWDTGALAEGARGRFVPQRAGTARYSCVFHPSMHGRLIVH